MSKVRYEEGDLVIIEYRHKNKNLIGKIVGGSYSGQFDIENTTTHSITTIPKDNIGTIEKIGKV